MTAWERLRPQHFKRYVKFEYPILIGLLNNVNCQHFRQHICNPMQKNFRHGIASRPWEKQQRISPMRVQRALSLSPVPFISKDRNIVGVDWFDVLMHCLKMGSTKWRRPVWCVSIGGHEKSHLAPEPGVSAAGGFEGPRGAGRWLHWCLIIHSAWPLYF